MAKGLAINQTFHGRDKDLSERGVSDQRGESVSLSQHSERRPFRRDVFANCKNRVNSAIPLHLQIIEVEDLASPGEKMEDMGLNRTSDLYPVNPLVSIILPARNADENIAAALDAIAQQEYTPYEVIIISDGSTDQTNEICQKYPYQLIVQEWQGTASAENAGVALARGEILYFTDADVVMPRDTLQRAVETLRNNPEAAGLSGCYSAETLYPNFFSAYKNALLVMPGYCGACADNLDGGLHSKQPRSLTSVISIRDSAWRSVFGNTCVRLGSNIENRAPVDS
jgi:hypothetical protein